MVSSLATKVHKTLHTIETDETMVCFLFLSVRRQSLFFTRSLRSQQPIFEKEPTGQPRKQKYIMGKRNWCRVEWDEQNGEVEFDIRVEREKGCGVTTGWVIYLLSIWWDVFVVD